MKASELRIGNYVGFGSLYCKVVEIQKQCFYVEELIDKEEYKNTNCELNPIKITEDLATIN